MAGVPRSDQELRLPPDSRDPTKPVWGAGCWWEDLVLQLDIARRREADARCRGDVELVIGLDHRAHRLLLKMSALATGPGDPGPTWTV